MRTRFKLLSLLLAGLLAPAVFAIADQTQPTLRYEELDRHERFLVVGGEHPLRIEAYQRGLEGRIDRELEEWETWYRRQLEQQEGLVLKDYGESQKITRPGMNLIASWYYSEKEAQWLRAGTIAFENPPKDRVTAMEERFGQNWNYTPREERILLPKNTGASFPVEHFEEWYHARRVFTGPPTEFKKTATDPDAPDYTLVSEFLIGEYTGATWKTVGWLPNHGEDWYGMPALPLIRGGAYTIETDMTKLAHSLEKLGWVSVIDAVNPVLKYGKPSITHILGVPRNDWVQEVSKFVQKTIRITTRGQGLEFIKLDEDETFESFTPEKIARRQLEDARRRGEITDPTAHLLGPGKFPLRGRLPRDPWQPDPAALFKAKR